MRFFGIIGMPLGHSFSPVYFKGKFEKEGIDDAYYNLYPLKKIDEFNQLINDFSELTGLNVTIPYKQSVIPFLDYIDPNAQEIGAVNTVKFERLNGKLFLSGYNTDFLGFTDSIKPFIKENHKKALILGTGGSSMAVAYALKKLNIEYKKVSRTLDSDQSFTYDLITEEVINEYKIIINTTPLGMYPNVLQCPDIPYNAISKGHLLYDLIYNPKQTKFLELGKEKGASIVNGMEMLINQAEYSWKIWNNIL